MIFHMADRFPFIVKANEERLKTKSTRDKIARPYGVFMVVYRWTEFATPSILPGMHVHEVLSWMQQAHLSSLGRWYICTW